MGGECADDRADVDAGEANEADAQSLQSVQHCVRKGRLADADG